MNDIEDMTKNQKLNLLYKLVKLEGLEGFKRLVCLALAARATYYDEKKDHREAHKYENEIAKLVIEQPKSFMHLFLDGGN